MLRTSTRNCTRWPFAVAGLLLPCVLSAAVARIQVESRPVGADAVQVIAPGTALASGDELRVAVTPARAGYLYLIAIGSSGSAVSLLPFDGAAPRRLAAGDMVRFPEDGGFVPLDARTGTETVLAFVSPQPLDSLSALLVRLESAGGSADLVKVLSRAGLEAEVFRLRNGVPDSERADTVAAAPVPAAIAPDPSAADEPAPTETAPLAAAASQSLVATARSRSSETAQVPERDVRGSREAAAAVTAQEAPTPESRTEREAEPREEPAPASNAQLLPADTLAVRQAGPSRQQPLPGVAEPQTRPRTTDGGVLSAQGSRIDAFLGRVSGSAPGKEAAAPVTAANVPGASTFTEAAPGQPTPQTMATLSAPAASVAEAVDAPLAPMDLVGEQGAASGLVLVVTPQGAASGVLVDARGLVLTTWHAVQGADSVAVLFKQRGRAAASPASRREAQVVRHSKYADLALLEVDGVPAGARPVVLAAGDAGLDGEVLHAVAQTEDGEWQQLEARDARLRHDSSWYSTRRVLHRAHVVRASVAPGDVGPGVLFDRKTQLVGLGTMLRQDRGELVSVSAATLQSFLAGAR